MGKGKAVIKYERPRHRWRNNVNMNRREYVARMRTDSSGIGRKSVAATVSTLLNIAVQLKAGYVLTDRTTVRLSFATFWFSTETSISSCRNSSE